MIVENRLSLRTCCSFLALAVLLVQAQADETPVEKALKSFGETTVQGYVQPLQDLFAANMTSGWYRSAAIPQNGFNISFNIIGMGALVSSDQEVFDYTSPMTGSKFKTATVFGKNRGFSADGLEAGPADGVINTSIFPLATLQATIGHVQGTELTIRFVPIPKISNLPAITFWGIGGRHSISQYFDAGDEPPVHLALGIFYNKISYGDIIGVTSFYLGPQVSKQFSVLEVYGGFGYTSNTMTLKFTPSATGAKPVDISLDGTDKVRGAVGVALNLGILHLHGDVNFGSVTSISTGLGFGF